MAKSGHIVAINKTPGGTKYNVLLSQYTPETKKWAISKESVAENVLIYAIVSGRVKISNADVQDGKLHGTTGSLDRFNADKATSVRPVVILSELRAHDEQGRLLGYKICTHDGVVKNVRLSDMITNCAKITNYAKANGINVVPIQNAMYVEATDTTTAHIKPYTHNQFIVEVMTVNKPTNIEAGTVNQAANNQQVSKLEEIFNKEQIAELVLGKKHGINYKLYGNKDLSAAQMRELRKALEDGINPRLYADPKFSVEAMKAYRFQQKYGVDVSGFINPAYNKAQIFELSTGVLSGVDISKMADPKNRAVDMAKIRIALENKIYKVFDITESDLLQLEN